MSNPNLKPFALAKPRKAKKSRKPLRRSVNRIKPRTFKRASEEAKYRKRVRAWLVGKICAVYPLEWATQCHHIFGRVGKLLLWEHGWMAVSERGHNWIHSNPAKAREMGFLCPAGLWNTMPKDL